MNDGRDFMDWFAFAGYATLFFGILVALFVWVLTARNPVSGKSVGGGPLYGYAELEEGEIPLRSIMSITQGEGGAIRGMLHLTDRRLIFTEDRPPGRVQPVALSEIRNWAVEPRKLKGLPKGLFPRAEPCLVVLETNGYVREFWAHGGYSSRRLYETCRL